MNALRNGLKGLLDLVYPPLCLFCDMRLLNGPFLCAECEAALKATCRLRASVFPDDFTWLKAPVYFDSLTVCWEFDDKLSHLIHRVKFQQSVRLGRWLGELAGVAMKPLLEMNDYVVPVPLHSKRKRQRGYNQSEIIARGMANNTPLVKALRRVKKTKTQTRLGGESRQANVRDAFDTIRPDRVRSKRIFLVDDVCTTGATLNNAAMALKKAGARSVTAVALARPGLHHIV